MKKWLNIFVYISILFLLYALWKADYLVVPHIHNYLFLIISIVFLFAGYFTKSIVWKSGLKSEKILITTKDSITSTGLAELGKYIPGKLWTIMGRAMYISIHYPISTSKASIISLNVQLLTIWSGLLIGLIGMIFIKVPINWVCIIAGGWLILSFVLFIRRFHDLIQLLIKKAFKREIQIPLINVFKRRIVLFWLFFDWLIRMTAFYFLIISLTEQSFNYALAFGFPIAITLGILAVIVPGGLGVREGIITLWLSNAGFSIEVATSLAITTRLWSLWGELGIFATGLLLKRKP